MNRTLTDTIALVTGASRGVGLGIAAGLGEAGATVYLTGRTVNTEQAAVPLPGTIMDSARIVNEQGGHGIPIRCDHNDDQQVEAVFRQIDGEQSRLDVLVNNAWAGYEGYVTGKHMAPDMPFWSKPIAYWDDNMVAVRWAYVASWFAAQRMTVRRAGLIVNISVDVSAYGNPAYNIAKVAVDRLTAEMAHILRPYEVAVISLYPGLVRTENVLKNAAYFDLSQSESPQFTGRAVAALAADSNVMRHSGKAFTVADLAREYGFTDLP